MARMFIVLCTALFACTQEDAPVVLAHRGLTQFAPENSIAAIREAVRVGADPDRLPHEALSNREFQVMRGLAAGRTPTEIAEDLSLSVKTVSTYRARILKKMNMENNAQLMRYAMQQRLID